MKNVNENIKKYRLEIGMTQQEVADQLFVTRQCISRWEQGKSVPDIEILEKLAQILGITMNEILDDESVKAMTINEAVKNRRTNRYVIASLMFSILAIIVTTAILFFNRSSQDEIEEPIEYKNSYGIITEINQEENFLLIEGED